MAYLSRRARIGRQLAVASAAVLAACATPVAAAPLEQAIKASYVTKFAPFVEWPASAFASPASPLMICLAGRTTFGPVIDDLARGQKVRARPLQIRRIGEESNSAGCHVLVIGTGTIDGLIADAAGKPVLTVTDTTAGIDGGMISFVRQAGRIRFRIDNGTARAAHLTISSKLLGLAVTVAP